MNQVKHFYWEEGESKGRVAVKVEYDRITIKQIAGHAPRFVGTANVAWWNALNQAFQINGVGLMAHAQQLHNARANRWALVDPPTMSGCSRMKLIVEKDAELLDFPVAARMHISMRGKLNEPVENMWLGDFIVFMEYIQSFSLDDDDVINLFIREVPTRTEVEWTEVDGD